MMPELFFPKMVSLRKSEIDATKLDPCLFSMRCKLDLAEQEKLFAFQHYGVVPDILTLAKGMGGGLPIGAFIADYDLMQNLTYDPMLGHITTFGGNPVCCAASNAVIDIFQSGSLLDHVEEKGQLFEDLLSSNPRVKEIRRKGLMLAIDFEKEEDVQHIVKTCIKRGVITYFFLSNRNSFRLAPPLTISLDLIKEACTVINEVIDQRFIND